MGRGAGRGRLEAVVRNGKRHYVGYWRDAYGARKSRTFGTNKAEAERLLTAEIVRRDKITAGLLTEVGLESPLEEVIRKHTQQLEVLGRAPSTVRSEGVDARRVVEVLGVHLVADLHITHSTEFQVRRKQQGVSHRTINKELDALARALNSAVRRGELATNPLKGHLKLPVTEAHRVKRRRALSNKEVAALFTALEEIDLKEGGVPQCPFFRVALLTGARRGELIDADWEDLDLEAQTLELRAVNTKTSKSRLAFLGPRGVEEVEILLDEVPDTGPIFCDRTGLRRVRKDMVSRLFTRAVTRAGLEKVDAQGRSIDLHALRTTYGTRAAEAGVELGTLQKLMGHATPITTATYYTKPKLMPLVEQARSTGFLEALEQL